MKQRGKAAYAQLPFFLTTDFSTTHWLRKIIGGVYRLEFRKNKKNLARGAESELIANMNKLGGSVSGRKTEQATYQPQVKEGSNPLDAAAIRRGKKQEVTLYGINESELKLMFDRRRTTSCQVSYLADRFKLKSEDIQNLLKFTTIPLTKPNPRVKGQLIAIRQFDSNPSV